jgi:hypothetical protein
MDTQNDKVTTDNVGVKRDWVIAGGSAAAFFALLKGAGWVDQNFDFSSIFNLVDFSVVAAKVTFASALVWTIMKFVFRNTLGKDFGETFDTGWNTMTGVEKTRWILCIFAVMFATVLITFQ